MGFSGQPSNPPGWFTQKNAQRQPEQLQALPQTFRDTLQSLKVARGAQQQGPHSLGRRRRGTRQHPAVKGSRSTEQHPSAVCHLRRGIPSHYINC